MGDSRLLKYFLEHGPSERAVFGDGAILNPRHFPVAAIETVGAILFADLPGFSRMSSEIPPAEAGCYVSHFFAWCEGSAGRQHGGIVDKFIGDCVMMVFVPSKCKTSPFEAALRTARDLLEHDSFGFDPKIGVASGPFAVALVGTEDDFSASAMGHTVNVAARCVQGTIGPKSITIATDDEKLVKGIFTDRPWKVHAPRQLEPKNMAPFPVINIERTTFRILNFDYRSQLTEMIRFAREQGAIVSDPKQSGPSADPDKGSAA